MNLYLEIITPEKVVFKDDIDEVIAPTVNGEIAILPNHVSLITQIKPGELIIKKGNKQYALAIIEGVMEVDSNKINILTNYAVRAENIEIAKAKEAKIRAEALMKEKATDRDFKIAEAELVKAILELKIGGKYKRNRPQTQPI